MTTRHLLYDIQYLTAIGLPPGGSSTVHIYTQTMHRTTQLTNWEEYGPCPVFAGYTLAFALQLRKKHGKTSIRVVGECHLARFRAEVKNGWTCTSTPLVCLHGFDRDSVLILHSVRIFSSCIQENISMFSQNISSDCVS